MRLKAKLAQRAPCDDKENGTAGRSSSKHYQPDEAPVNLPKLHQRPPRGLRSQQPNGCAPRTTADTSATAAGSTRSNQPETDEDEAQAALLLLASFGRHGNSTRRQLQVTPDGSRPAPITCTGEEGRWLADMCLSPLTDLHQLQPELEAPGYGWPVGIATPRLPSVPPTPAALLQLHLLGTPVSQLRVLPTPEFLDFGGPAVPPNTKDSWHSRQRPIPWAPHGTHLRLTPAVPQSLSVAAHEQHPHMLVSPLLPSMTAYKTPVGAAAEAAAKVPATALRPQPTTQCSCHSLSRVRWLCGPLWRQPNSQWE
jgi:hypothetical protein